jgi:two-component system cell cycle sensor histidine kinase/response regulator CckA
MVDFSIKPLFDSTGAIRNFIVQGMDVTEQRRTEEKLRQSMKMDAIGQLAGGIAHDFNNMLGAIIGSAELISQDAGNNNRLNKFTNLIINSAENAAVLTKKWLVFSRKGKAVSTPIDAHECINNSLDILERTIDKNIVISRRLEAENATIIGDPIQIQTAVINLGVNASHAMQGGGELTIFTSNVTLNGDACREMPFELHPGNYLRIKVKDTGAGIPDRYLDRIFEPFFTTKETGKGTGLGLATVYGMAKEHYGAVTVDSKEGKGTQFVIFLPSEDMEVASPKHELMADFSGQGCILVIDDEEIIRTTAMSILNRLGYEVMLAVDGQDGVEVFQENQERIELVITDMVMPRMSGSVCYQHIRELSPEVPVILSSGFSQQQRVDELKKQGISAVIEKPYRMHELAKIIHGILMQGAPGKNA